MEQGCALKPSDSVHWFGVSGGSSRNSDQCPEARTIGTKFLSRPSTLSLLPGEVSREFEFDFSTSVNSHCQCFLCAQAVLGMPWLCQSLLVFQRGRETCDDLEWAGLNVGA